MTVHAGRAIGPHPGGRYREQGPASGEELREAHLRPAYDEARRRGVKLEVRLEGAEYGWPVGFLEEAFGGLARAVGGKQACETVRILSDDCPEAAAEATELMKDAGRPAGSP